MTQSNGISRLRDLAAAIRRRNVVAEQVASLVGRPALIGHVGEFIASRVFGIELEESASAKGIDGHFQGGPLAGMSVNVKWSTKHDGLLNVNPEALPDYYLVLAGPRTPAVSSRGSVRPWVIESVFLFDASSLVARLRQRGVKVGVATSVVRALWDEAEVDPVSRNPALTLADAQREALALFAGGEEAKVPVRADLPTEASKVWRTIRDSVQDDDELLTPGRGVPPTNQKRFRVGRIGQDFLRVDVGEGGHPIRMPANAFEAVVGRLRSAPASTPIGAIHEGAAAAGTVEATIREATGMRVSCASYLAAILEHAGVAEYVMEGHQKHIRLQR